MKRFSCFSQSLSVYAAERQTRGRGWAMTYAWRRRSQRWIVAHYWNALLFGVTMRVMRYILPKVTGYFLPKLVKQMIFMFV